jgi:FMN phosphatase YigB (HAD superfamily)
LLIDAGGVLVLPDRAAVSEALGPGMWSDAPEVLDEAHYRAIAAVDKARPSSDREIFPYYVAAYLEALGVSGEQKQPADRLARLLDAGTPSWRTVVPSSVAALRLFSASDRRVVIVSNSQGWMERHLRELGVCQVGPGPGASVTGVVDSALVGAEKPDARIFLAALQVIGSRAEHAVHIGDSVWFDVEGALAAGLGAIHFDPHHLCAVDAHQHIASLADLDLASVD